MPTSRRTRGRAHRDDAASSPPASTDADAVGTTLNGADLDRQRSSGDQAGLRGGRRPRRHAVTGIDDVVLGRAVRRSDRRRRAAGRCRGRLPDRRRTGDRRARDASACRTVGTTIAGESLTGTQPGEHAGSSIAGNGRHRRKRATETSSSGRRTRTSSADPDAGTVYLVTNTELPFGRKLRTRRLHGFGSSPPVRRSAFRTGALATTVNLVGDRASHRAGALPGPVPAGNAAPGGGRASIPRGRSSASPFATDLRPLTIAALESQLTNRAVARR